MSIVNYTDLMAAQRDFMSLMDGSPQALEKVNTVMPELIQICETAQGQERVNALKIADTFGIAFLSELQKNPSSQLLQTLVKQLSDLLKRSEPAVVSVMIRLEGNPTMTLDFLRTHQDYSRLKTQSIFEDINRQLFALSLFEPQSVRRPPVIA